MAWNQGDIVSVTFNQQMYEQDMLNKVFWRIVSVVGTVIIEEILDFLLQEFVNSITATQIDALAHTTQTVLNETDGISFVLAQITDPGHIADDGTAASFNAAGLTKVVGTRLTRPGGIRIAGVPASGIQDNDLTSAMIVLYGVFATWLEDSHTYIDSGGGEMTFEPVVVGRTPLGAIDLARVNPVTGVGNIRLTSQVSRRA